MTELAVVAACLARGNAAVVPTDTVYGLAALPEHARVLFELKERPATKGLPVLGTGAPALAGVAAFDERASDLAGTFWPGPLTLVLPRARSFSADLGGVDPGTVAVRVPAHDLVLQLLRITGPLAVTSANLSGERPATTVEEARRTFGDGAGAYLDGGACDGTPSTVLRLTGPPEVLREGGLERETILEALRTPRTTS